MSSSDEAASDGLDSAQPPSWDAFEERDVPAYDPDGAVSPEAELAALLQRYQEDLRVARGASSTALTAVRGLAFELATLTGRLAQLLAAAEAPMAASGQRRMHRQMSVVKDQMLQALRDGGIEVRDPLGLRAAEVEDWADAVGWRHGPEFTDEVVARTYDPAVFHDGAVVSFARVLMGAPPEPEPEPEEPEPEPAPEEPAPEPGGPEPEPGREEENPRQTGESA